MEKTLLTFALLGGMAMTTVANAHGTEKLKICTINSEVTTNRCDVYTLTVSGEVVSSIVIDRDGNCANNIDKERAAVVLARLISNAEYLQNSGVCRATINNIMD